ncbi:MAG TPA: DUF2231 domain-containing protein [Acidimicrobiales bacterium]|nr:DUF2231 domain-containing protein [Acidimicrobiales bacterium]
MSRSLSFRPSLTLEGRKFKGLRGWAGKPFHPPLTDVPVGAYVLAPAFDVISYLGRDEAWARDFYRAATFTLVGGALVSVLTVLTGFWDWLKSTKKGTQARRTVNAHAWTMVTVSVLVAVDLFLRLVLYDTIDHTPGRVMVVSLGVLVLTVVGGTIGGGLTYDYGFNVETAGDHPVWHESENDVLPGDHSANS